MSKHRRKQVDPRGHVERPTQVRDFVECANCRMVKLKSQPWARECASAEKARAA